MSTVRNLSVHVGTSIVRNLSVYALGRQII